MTKKKNKNTETRDATPQENRSVCLAQSIMALRHRLYKMASECAPGSNLKSSELALLITLGRTGTQSMSDLAKACFFSPPNATYIVSSLEKKGLVKRERSDKSSRVVFVNMTPAGRTVFEQTYPLIVRRMNKFFGDRLSDVQIDVLEQVLTKLTAD
ncbi:MarR family transcriptional regulator [Emcibacter sp.]|uniref:MarR family winged helix-turn-helix transcriptional regulator n=1 Tax=Emcibacter sp. TaxID=1979954 RepID=UPI002AA95DBB|nr:MarR family transcriptional regulator [Emcibacter sp.]